MYYRDKQRKKETDKLRQVKNSAEFVKGLNEMSEKLRDKIEPNILISTITAESSPDAFKTLKTMFDSSNKSISNMRWHIVHSDSRSSYMSNVIAVPAQMRTNMVDEHRNHIWKDRHLQLSLGQSKQEIKWMPKINLKRNKIRKVILVNNYEQNTLYW